MKALFLILTFSLFSFQEEIIEHPDQQAEFPGGMGAIGKFLQKNLKYPETAKRANVSGKIYLQFVVEKDGSLSNIQHLKNIGFGMEDEGIRVMKLSPKWTPAIHKSKIVRSLFTLPMTICLE